MAVLLFGTAFAGGTSDNSDDETIVDDSVDEETPVDPVTLEASFAETDGDDLLDFESFEEDEDGFLTLRDAEIDTLAGNDTIDFLDQADVDAFNAAPDTTPDSRVFVADSTINTGEGDDTLRLSGNSTSIDTGAGDDVIFQLGGSDLTINAGDGDDTITSSALIQTIDGQDGDDTIDVSFSRAFTANGGAGNDTITFMDPTPEGNGFGKLADGGDGDDTINYTGNGHSDFYESGTIVGGAGADVFNLTLDEDYQNAGRFENGGEGSFEELTPDEDGIVRLNSISISDFTAGEDQLVINADAQVEGYIFTSANLINDDTPGDGQGTTITLTYESETDPTRTVSIDMGESAVSWDDVTFEGEQSPELLVDGVAPAPFAFTDGDDVFIQGTTEAEFTGEILDLRAGNDLFDLLADDGELAEGEQGDTTFDQGIPATTISGGEGDDTLILRPQNITVEGNAGNDTITAVNAAGATIAGGAGDDTLTVTNPSTDAVTVRGGEGNDIIDATGVDNGSVNGGAGNDTISFDGGDEGGAGYVKIIAGGAGDDTLNFAQGAFIDSPLSASSITGGEGADTFNLTINEGGDFFEAPRIDETQTLPIINIGDFETGEDMLVVDASSIGEAFTLTTARLDGPESETDDPETSLVLRYESDTEAPREVVVQLGTAPIVWDDVSFIGEETPVLL